MCQLLGVRVALFLLGRADLCAELGVLYIGFSIQNDCLLIITTRNHLHRTHSRHLLLREYTIFVLGQAWMLRDDGFIEH